MESLPADVISHMSHRNQPWSVDALCRTPSLAMADILVQCINMATSTLVTQLFFSHILSDKVVYFIYYVSSLAQNYRTSLGIIVHIFYSCKKKQFAI